MKDCQHVIIKNIYFDGCWPTGIYIDNCQDIKISECHFREGTFAIGATGSDTRHITISRCHWQQYPDVKGFWKNVSWDEIHADLDAKKPGDPKGKVGYENDHRELDGDFFVGWRIAGFVTIHNCIVEDAFNAIHMFNLEGEPPSTKLNRNVLIEDNCFRNICDNAVEPEFGAWNWIIRRNCFYNVYRWFSFELYRSGWFYIYANLGWHDDFPGLLGSKQTGESLLKFPKPKVLTQTDWLKEIKADGPHYIFHNSFHMRGQLFKIKKSIFKNWIVFNNAFSFDKIVGPSNEDKDNKSLARRTLFGDTNTNLGAIDDAIKEQFQFLGNVIEHAPSPEELRRDGMRFEESSIQTYPGFVKEKAAKQDDFKLLKGKAAARGNAIAYKLRGRAVQYWQIERGKDCGAWQGNSLYALPQSSVGQNEFEWVDPPKPPKVKKVKIV